MNLARNASIPDEPYPELRGVLEVFAAGIKTELGANLLGIYLVGSLASGDFDLDSDVDFLVVMKTELAEEARGRLQAIHAAVHDMGCYPARHLEGSYISISDLNDRSGVGKKELFYFDNGSTTPEQSTHDNNWHVRWILRERGIALMGPPPETLLPTIPADELAGEMKASMLQILKGFKESIDQPLNFWNSQFGQPFAVLTACRVLHVLQTGIIQSKRAAAEWAKESMEPKWRTLIDRAWRDREGVRFCVKIGLRSDGALLEETVEFLQRVADGLANGNRVEQGPEQKNGA